MNKSAVRKFTRKLLREFDKLTRQAESANQIKRIHGRLMLNKFIEKHGKETCDAMWAEIISGSHK